MKSKPPEFSYPLKGIRHLALRVTDITRAKAFYEGLLGMKPVWEPDPQNIYLTSGTDNLALHEISQEERACFRTGTDQPLDHIGFLVETPQAVESIARQMAKAGITIIKPPRRHRDGSHSFYIADPDGNTIQILYEPNIS